MRAWSLQSKLLSLTVLSATTVLAALGAVQYTLERRHKTAALEAAVESAAARLAVNLEDPVWNMALEQSSSTIERELLAPDVVAIVLREHSGGLLTAMMKKDDAAVPITDTAVLPAGLRTRAFEIRKDGRVIADGEVRYGREALNAQLRSTLVMTLVQIVLVDGILVAVLLAVVAALVLRPLGRLTAAAAGMAAGDLRQEVRMSARDEIGALAGSFQSMAGGLRSMVSGLGDVARQLDDEGREIVGTVSRQATMASQQAAAISESSSTAAEIAQTSKAATEHADRVIEVAHRSEELSLQGKSKVEEVVTSMLGLGEQVKASVAAMNQLAQRAQQIGDVVATVKELAEQSNLLALNAAIEASRAGEHGRGFSVVALEMRNLAEQSKAAAGRVRNMLGEVQKWTEEAVQATRQGEKQTQSSIQLARSAGESIEGLAEAIRESSLAAKQIANNTRQQTVGVEQIVAAIEQVSEAMSETVVGTKQIERGTVSLSELSSRLLKAVQRYQV